MPIAVTYLNHTSIFEWYLVWRGSKNKYRKEVGLHAQNMITVLVLIVNIIGGGGKTYMTI